MRLRHFLLLLQLSMLTACTVGPSFERPESKLPEQWQMQAHSSAQIDEQWWKQFGDAKLNELIEQARQNNLDMRLAALRVAESRIQRSIAAGSRWPGVSASGTYQRERQSEHGVNTRLIDIIGPPDSREAIINALSEPFDLYQAGFDASWEIDLWGRVRRSVEAADATSLASREDLHDAELTLIAEVTRTYLELLGTRDQLRIAREDVVTGTDQLELTQFRVNGGLVTDLDLNVQRAEIANTRAQVPGLEQRERQLQNALALMVGRDPGSLDDMLEGETKRQQIIADVATGIPSELARRRPDIRRAEARLHAATAEIGVAVADLYPRISLTGSFVTQALDASDLSDWGSRQWTIGPSLTLPIFQGGRLRNVIELRKVQQQEAAVSYQRTVLGAWHEIENALDAYQAEKQRSEELANVLSASAEAYDIAHVRYEHGLTNYLVDLDAHRTLLQAQRAYSESSTRVGVQLVSLCKALGGGWSDSAIE